MPSIPNPLDFVPPLDFAVIVGTLTGWVNDLWTPEGVLPLPPPLIECKTFVFVPLQPTLITKVLCCQQENLPLVL